MRYMALLAALFALPPATFAESYVVISKRAGLSAKSKQQHVLLRGEVVEGKRHEWDRALLRVTYKDKQYLAHKKYFRSQRDVLTEFSKKRVAAEAEIKGINQQLLVNYKRSLKLHGAILLAEHDTAIHYKQKTGGRQVKGQGIVIGDSGVGGKLVVILTEAQAKKAIAGWQKELKELTAKTVKLHEERKGAVEQVFVSTLQRQQYKDLFKRYERSAKTYRSVPHRVVDRNARIFRKDATPVVLREKDWVLALPSRENAGTSFVRHEGKTYNTHSKYLKSDDDVAQDFLTQRLELEDEVRLIENEMKILAARMELYVPLIPDLKYRTNLKKNYVYIPKISTRPGSDGMLKITVPEEERTAYALNISLAKKLQKQWSKELEDLEVALRKKAKALGSARKKIEALKSDEEEATDSLKTFKKRLAEK